MSEPTFGDILGDAMDMDEPQWIIDAVKIECDKARDEGRHEILREIAALPSPYGDIDECVFCRVEGDEHTPTCLWLRATRAPQEPVK